MQNTIKKKSLQFKHNEFTYHVQIVYDFSPFGYGEKSFWKIRLYKVNDKHLQIPLEYHYVQSRGFIMQSLQFREHSFHCTTRRKDVQGKTNLYPIVKAQIIYQYTNRKAILKYESKVSNFKFLVELKYQPQLDFLRIQKKQLKLKLKSNEIDNKQYQRLYTPIRKNRDKVQFYIWDICYRFKGRYFFCGRLKEIYR
jgi:hypothetical protein